MSLSEGSDPIPNEQIEQQTNTTERCRRDMQTRIPHVDVYTSGSDVDVDVDGWMDGSVVGVGERVWIQI